MLTIPRSVRIFIGSGKRFEAIARDLGLTRGRISQLHRQALQRLRSLLRRRDGVDVAY